MGDEGEEVAVGGSPNFATGGGRGGGGGRRDAAGDVRGAGRGNGCRGT
jgi:hypothetical protein